MNNSIKGGEEEGLVGEYGEEEEYQYGGEGLEGQEAMAEEEEVKDSVNEEEVDPVEAFVTNNLIEETDEEGRKAWKCGVCEWSRKSKFDVGRHIEQHMSLELPCPICQSIYTRRDKLKAHLKKIHGVI